MEMGMETHIPMSDLGKYLALLEHQRDHGTNPSFPDLSAEDRFVLKQLEQRLQNLEQENTLKGIIDTLPSFECHTEHPILEGHYDFFLYLFLLHKSTQKRHNLSCTHIFRHLNYCFRCFKIFSMVSRSFFQKKEELHNRNQQVSGTAE